MWKVIKWYGSLFTRTSKLTVHSFYIKRASLMSCPITASDIWSNDFVPLLCGLCSPAIRYHITLGFLLDTRTNTILALPCLIVPPTARNQCLLINVIPIFFISCWLRPPPCSYRTPTLRSICMVGRDMPVTWMTTSCVAKCYQKGPFASHKINHHANHTCDNEHAGCIMVCEHNSI